MGNFRLYFIIALFLVFSAALESRLFDLQIKNGFEKSKETSASTSVSRLLIKRGSIFIQDKSGKRYSVAYDKEGFRLWVDKFKLKDISLVSRSLASVLKTNEINLKEKINRAQNNYEVINDFVEKDSAQKIKSLKLRGVNLDSRDLRSYPFETLAANVLGFVSYQNNQPLGQYGIEGFYNSELNGLESDSYSKENVTEEKIGKSLVLTIDYNIQMMAERALIKIAEQNQASSGSIIIMDPKTGEILGMASLPFFNPNEYSKFELADFKNNAIQENYEPGSVFKVLTMAAGLQEKAILPSTIYEDKGVVLVKNTAFQNFDGQGRGAQTMTQVLEKSLNTGAVFVEQKINRVSFLGYLRKFGIGSRTGIDLSGETKGDIRNLYNFNEIDYAAASFGQGITATPIQIISAVSSIANNGVMMKPYVVKSIINSDNTETVQDPEILGEPIKPFVAAQLTGMMVSVANNGLDKRAKIPGYQIAVKTGTAQIADPKKKGYLPNTETVHTIVGFVPAFNPKFAMLIRIDRPHGKDQFASDTLGIPFRDLTQALLNYYQVPPTEPL